jgi:hypothetical protein
MSMWRHDILTAKWLNSVNSNLFPASHLFNLPKHLYGPHTQLYPLLLLLSPAKQPIFHPPNFLIPFDFGRPFFYRISYSSPLFSTSQTQPTTSPIINIIKMRFSVIAAAVMATAVSAGEAVYYSTTVSPAQPASATPQTNQYQSTTVIDTITSCGPEVTNCPAKTYTSTLSNATSYPVYANTSAPVTTSTFIAAPTYPVYPVSSPVSLATSYITTCIPTVITNVYTVTPTPVASSTGYISYAQNAT